MKTLLFSISALLLLVSCSEDNEVTQQAYIRKIMEGNYNIVFKHFDSGRDKMIFSELAQVDITYDARNSSSFTLAFDDDTVRLTNVYQIENVMIFNMNCHVEGVDDFGNPYILRPYEYYDINNKKYPGYFEIVNDKLILYFKKEYVYQKMAYHAGYVDVEAFKK